MSTSRLRTLLSGRWGLVRRHPDRPVLPRSPGRGWSSGPAEHPRRHPRPVRRYGSVRRSPVDRRPAVASSRPASPRAGGSPTSRLLPTFLDLHPDDCKGFAGGLGRPQVRPQLDPRNPHTVHNAVDKICGQYSPRDVSHTSPTRSRPARWIGCEHRENRRESAGFRGSSPRASVDGRVTHGCRPCRTPAVHRDRRRSAAPRAAIHTPVDNSDDAPAPSPRATPLRPRRAPSCGARPSAPRSPPSRPRTRRRRPPRRRAASGAAA